MGTTLGWISLATGLGLVFAGIPRRGEECRPFLRPAIMPVVYPSLCLVLISFGLVALTATLLR